MYTVVGVKKASPLYFGSNDSDVIAAHGAN